MKQRWGFLAPWFEVLTGNIAHVEVDLETNPVWKTQMFNVEVELPKRDLIENNETEFLAKFQKTREALALLAAVAHVDYDAWKYLLTSYCGLRLGQEGELEGDVHLSPTYQLILDLKDHKSSKNSSATTFDLVQFCGVHQSLHPTQSYLETLSKISSLRPGKSAVDLQIPVHVYFAVENDTPVSEQLRKLKNIGKAQQMIRDEWSLYTKKSELQQVATGSLQCTFVLEPIDSDFGVDGITTDMIEIIDGFTRDDLHTSQLHLRLATELAADEWKAMKAFGQLTTRVFAGSREISKPRREEKASQRRSLRLLCDNSLSLLQIEAMCSAIVRTQTLDELWLRFDLAPHVRDWWKWLGYAFFSKRARASSTLRTVNLTGIDSMTMEDIAVFTLVFGSERPEEDLHGLLLEPVEGKDAVLKEYAPIRWKFDEDGQPCNQAKLFQIAAPISVQTYSDDGESTWINVMVPGYGRCQVPRDDLDFGRNEAVESTQPGVTSLTIAFANCDDPDFSGLLLSLLLLVLR